MRTSSVSITILPQICTVRCTKLRKHFKAIVEVFYCFTVSIGLPAGASDYNEDERSAVAARMQNNVFVEWGNSYPLYTALLSDWRVSDSSPLAYLRERSCELDIGAFLLRGIKDLLHALGLWYCESWGIGENEKLKAVSTAQRCIW